MPIQKESLFDINIIVTNTDNNVNEYVQIASLLTISLHIDKHVYYSIYLYAYHIFFKNIFHLSDRRIQHEIEI